tara:strand:- start:70 stop:234 length:165 start_codon:yes stop_codon:yes gene_type:complete
MDFLQMQIEDLSEEDQRLLRLGPQFYLPDQVIRYQHLKKMLEDKQNAKESTDQG